MVEVIKKEPRVPAPKVIEATLMTYEENLECGRYAAEPGIGQPCYWYLRTPGDEADQDEIECADEDILYVGYYDSEPQGCDPDYVDYPPDGPRGTGIRPVLRIESPKLSDEVTLEPGDKVMIGGELLTYVSHELLMADDAVNWDEDEGEFSAFDANGSNVYEESDAKRIVDRWFENRIKPYLD